MLVTLSSLSFGYGDTPILDGVDLAIGEGDRIGLVGANGAGKTTLLRLITGELVPQSGEIAKKSRLSVGYLAQTGALESGDTVAGAMRRVFAETDRAIGRQREIERELASLDPASREYRALSAEYARLTALIDAKDGYRADVRIRTVLYGLGFAGEEERTVDTMSGGEKTRLALARLLLESPELLILDEPTNHLDLRALAFLEDYLASYRGALLLVSHDRYFLDRTADRIWDTEDGTVTPYRGNYSAYKTAKAERIKAQAREYERQSEEIRRMREYAERNGVRASTAKSAKSRLKAIDRMDPVEKPIAFRRPPSFRFEADEEPVKTVLAVRDFPIEVGGKRLVPPVSFEVARGERLAIVGANGTGKTTLMRALAAGKDPRIRYGLRVRTAYFDQENLDLDPNAVVLDELWNRFPRAGQTGMRALLARVLLGEEDVKKTVRQLSGGERAKLAFAVVMAERGNVLLLDEPTNHLDLAAREALEAALTAFDGTVIFVSHDRYFLNAVATRTAELTPEGLFLRAGNYDDLIAAARSSPPPEKEPPRASPRDEHHRTARDRAEEAKKKERIRALEIRISELEAEQKRLSEEIGAGGDYREIAEKCARMEAAAREAEELESEWEKLLSSD